MHGNIGATWTDGMLWMAWIWHHYWWWDRNSNWLTRDGHHRPVYWHWHWPAMQWELWCQVGYKIHRFIW